MHICTDEHTQTHRKVQLYAKHSALVTVVLYTQGNAAVVWITTQLADLLFLYTLKNVFIYLFILRQAQVDLEFRAILLPQAPHAGITATHQHPCFFHT